MSSPGGPAGLSAGRVDAKAKVTGQARFAIDESMPGMLHAQIVRSTRAHAMIEAIETASARQMEGVHAVLTAADLKGLFPRFGHIIADRPVLAIDRVRYYGEPVALVVGDTAHAAADAAERVVVQYRDLPALIQAEEALAPGAPILHDEDYQFGDATFDEAQSQRSIGNIAHEVLLEWGEVDEAFSKSAHVVATTTKYPMLYAYAMEPYNALAVFDDDGLDIVSTAQHPFQVSQDLARIFSLPLNRVRVRSLLLGGGYGSKSYTKVEPLAAVGAWASGRPVRLTLDVEGSIHTTRADSAVVSVRSGFDSAGRLVVRAFEITMNGGAYADNGPLVLAKSVNRCFGPYRIPNLRVVGRSVYTNTVPSSSYRGFGAPHGNLAGELNIDQAAVVVGLDAGEIRRRNLVGYGEPHMPGKRSMDADLSADLEIVLEKIGWNQEIPEHHGIGFGCSASDAGAYPVSTAIVRVVADGSVLVLTGSTEMGQGSRTVLAQIAASELGLPLDRVRVIQSDTAVTPYERTTGASRTTTLTGLAVQRACRDALSKLAEMAADAMGCQLAEVKVAEGAVVGPDRSIEFDEVVQSWFGGRQGEVVGLGVVRREGALEALPPFWEIGMVAVHVSVHPETGVVTVEHLVTVGDVGFAINPELVKGQDLGAATQGLGAALHEELVYDGPQLLNPNLVEYRVPRASDAPRMIDSVIAARQDGVGPYGAKGAGEGALNPIGAAVAAAVAHAIRVWPDRLPLTPNRVWDLMNPSDGD